jgi:FkbM family methyltransferase
MHSSLEAIYAGALRILTAGRGLPWRIDDRTTLRIDPRCRWIRHPDYEADVVSYLRARVRPGHVSVDVGAHVGFYVLQLAHWSAPGGRVVALEPNPTARAVLESNVALNGIASQVTIEPVAAGAAPGNAQLFHAGEATGLSRLGSPNPASAGDVPVMVDVVTLDDYCAKGRLAPDWILIDAEGAELNVLEGAAALLTHSPVQVVVEMHGTLWDDLETTTARFQSLLRACGRTAVPITGQTDAFADYGTVVLERL